MSKHHQFYLDSISLRVEISPKKQSFIVFEDNSQNTHCWH